jgi:hypothetical protein
MALSAIKSLVVHHLGIIEQQSNNLLNAVFAVVVKEL